MNKLTSLLALLTFTALTGCGSSAAVPTTPAAGSTPKVQGGWKSACTPSSDTQAFVLDFDIADKTWALDYVVFGDKACGTRFLTVHIEGPYELGAASGVVGGAWDARFAFTKKTITPHSAAAAGFLGSDAGCKLPGFAEGVAKDISETGCAALGQYPVAKCPADFDVVRVDGDRLTFGNRPADNDLCTEAKRPRALAALSSARK